MRVYGPDGMGRGISGVIAQVLRPHDLPLIVAAPRLLANCKRAEEVLNDFIGIYGDGENGELTDLADELSAIIAATKAAP